uniref:Ras-associating domain-containing protein n=1 Tax=Angiostrongylus cantonensis TaxID=6313 RepID=A0A0K0DQY8_ANGCA
MLEVRGPGGQFLPVCYDSARKEYVQKDQCSFRVLSLSRASDRLVLMKLISERFGLPCMKWNDPSVLFYGISAEKQANWDHNFCRILEDEK